MNQFNKNISGIPSFDEPFTSQIIGSATQQDPLVGIHSDNLPSHDLDFPPRPRENVLDSPPRLENQGPNQSPGTQDINDLLGLERELEFGLDRQF